MEIGYGGKKFVREIKKNTAEKFEVGDHFIKQELIKGDLETMTSFRVEIGRAHV